MISSKSRVKITKNAIPPENLEGDLIFLLWIPTEAKKE